MTTNATARSTAFQSALAAWMKREFLTVGRAARYLGVKCSDVQGWLAGTSCPGPEQITHVLSRIAAGRK